LIDLKIPGRYLVLIAGLAVVLLVVGMFGQTNVRAATSTQLIVNGDFETGDLSGWTVTPSRSDRPTRVNWVINDGTVNPLYGAHTPLGPIAGSYDALSLGHQGRSSERLWQPISMPYGIVDATISWSDIIRSGIDDPRGAFNEGPPGSSAQEFRVIFTDNLGALLGEVWSTDPGDPQHQPGPNARSFDITALAQSLAGRTVFLGFEQEQCCWHFNTNVDDISFLVETVPDTTPPEITPVVTGTLGNNGWYTSDIDVSWNIVEFGSPTTSISGCGSTSVTVDTNGMTFTCSATSGGGSASESVTVKRDATVPVMTSTSTSSPNVYGWNNTPVVATYTASDAMSGIDPDASDLGDDVLSTSGVGQLTSGTAVDLAGNSSSIVDGPINIDLEAPLLSCDINPKSIWPPNHKMVDVTATVNLTDALSGPDGFVLSSVSSDEADSGLGGGDVPNDIQDFDMGTTDTEGQVRAERDDASDGRTYSVVYVGSDLAGNTAQCDLPVQILHDKGRND
jgi:hypothetical protein